MSQIVRGGINHEIILEQSCDLNIAQGYFVGRSIFNEVGRNSDVDAPEDVWEGGGFYTGQPTTGSAETVTVTSSAGASDAGAVVSIRGLDSDYNIIFEDVTLDGTGIGTSTNLYWRLHIAQVKIPAAGQSSNVGTITITMSTATTVVFTVIMPNIGLSTTAAATVPAGHTAFLKRARWSILDNSSNRATIAYRVRPYQQAEYMLRPSSVSTDVFSAEDFYGGIRFEEKTDVVARILDIANVNGDISAYFDILLVRNDQLV